MFDHSIVRDILRIHLIRFNIGFMLFLFIIKIKNSNCFSYLLMDSLICSLICVIKLDGEITDTSGPYFKISPIELAP